MFEGILNYMKTFNNIHDLNVMLGYSYEKYSAESRSANGKGLSTDLFEWNNLGAASIKGVEMVLLGLELTIIGEHFLQDLWHGVPAKKIL